jgi:lipoprotein-releasing system permease protein
LFELQIALKYLIPKKKSLSTALISGLSVFVISLVIWLVLVFLSVLSGIEKNWLQKLTSLHAPIRISPTDEYYHSYFYQIDSIASASNYTLKTIGEKAASSLSDPYAEKVDVEVPFFWAQRDLSDQKLLKDPVKIACQELSNLKLTYQDYEIGGALLRLSLNSSSQTNSYLSQMSYLLSISDQNPQFSSLILEPIHFDLEPASPPEKSAYFVKGVLHFPKLQNNEEPIFLPKSYKDSGATIGNAGTLNYISPSAVSSQEQKILVRVVGFYDPGVLAVGNKCILVPSSVTRTIASATQTFSPDGTPTNGIFVWIKDLREAHLAQAQIIAAFEKAQIAPYWKVATFEEFEFSKDLLGQFRSDQTLFLLIASIILIVACSNIISLLILLVNDKKKEIAILQSMGASFQSIATIFGLCGALMGILSCLFGYLAAVFTLRHLDGLVSILSALQGRSAFNPNFFGHSLPNQLSLEAVSFVLIVTPLLCLAAGLIPALKASKVRPSSILRSE